MFWSCVMVRCHVEKSRRNVENMLIQEMNERKKIHGMNILSCAMKKVRIYLYMVHRLHKSADSLSRPQGY